MALLLVDEDGMHLTECPLCGEVLAEPIFATSHFIDDPADELWAYSDAGMHWQCYAEWKHQARFAKQYFDTVADSDYKNPYWPTILELPDILVHANCELGPPQADVYLQAVGPAIRVDLAAWEEWLAGRYKQQCLHPIQLSALESAVPSIREKLPTLQAVREAAAAARDSP